MGGGLGKKNSEDPNFKGEKRTSPHIDEREGKISRLKKRRTLSVPSRKVNGKGGAKMVSSATGLNKFLPQSNARAVYRTKDKLSNCRGVCGEDSPRL